MRTGDFLWLGALGAVAALLLVPATHNVFISLTKAFPYLIGFVKFAILATMGELLALRIVTGQWKQPAGLIYRAIIWGLFGMTFVLIFDVFATGIGGAVKKGLLPGGESSFMVAFWISAIMNFTFAPTFMAVHRITDTYLDLAEGSLGNLSKVSLSQVIGHIDWNGYVSFVVLKTVPFFWVPAHTVTFMLPPEYRVLVAAFLSIALGGILAFAKRKSAPKPA